MNRLLFIAALLGILFSFATSSALAATCGGVACTGSCIGGTYCVNQVQGAKTGDLAYFVGRFYEFTLPIAGIVGFVLILYAGFLYLSSKGDPKAVMQAQGRLSYAIGGLVLVFLAYAILGLVTFMFGLRKP